MRTTTVVCCLSHVATGADIHGKYIDELSDSKVICSGNSNAVANTTAIIRSRREITQEQEKEVTDKKKRTALS